VSVISNRFSKSPPPCAGCGEFDRVGHQIEDYLPDPRIVREDDRCNRRLDAALPVEAFCDRLRFPQVFNRIHQGGDAAISVFDLQLAGLDLRDIEDVVEDRQQRLAGRMDRTDFVLLFFIEAAVGVEQQICHADDTAQRGPEFMAHRGEEFRFGQIGN
jgi:hypothetical protein